MPNPATTVGAADHDATRRQLEASEAKYRSLFDAMDQGFCVFEMIFDASGAPVDYRFLEINPRFEEQTGLQQAVGKTARELVPGLEQHWFELYGKVATTGESTRFTQGSAAMGRWFDVYAFRIGDPAAFQVALLFTDISEQKRAEEKLLENERSLRKTIQESPAAICLLRGPQFVVEIANNSILQLWGKTEAVIGLPLFEAIPEAADQGFEELLTAMLETGEAFSVKERPVTLPRSGNLRTVYINASYEPIREGDGTISGIISTAIDITDQISARREVEVVVAQRTRELAAANEALQGANTELNRSNSHLEEFAHAASHDLKEPVRKIQFFADRLKTQLHDRISPEQLALFSRMTNAAERMQQLIDDLLLFSHVSLQPKEKEAVPLRERLDKALEDLEIDVEEKGARIEIGALPVVPGYGRQLQQLFQNLLSNALKYSRADVPPVIRISAETVALAGRDHSCIRIEDNGIGFEQEHSAKIFHMFTRLHGRGEYSGTGVGLAIVKKIIENHNGAIEVESAPGAGAAFRIYLPLA